MLRNYFKTAFRNLVRNTTFSVINITGLAIGIATSVLLLLWSQDELSFDRFHSKADRIYRLNANFINDGVKTTWQTTSGPLAHRANKEVTAVEMAGRISGEDGLVLMNVDGKNFIESNNMAYVDANFFQVFDFPLLKGNVTKPFPNTKSIIITEKIAKKYFADADPIGKIIQRENKDEFTVVGVAENFPDNSSIRYDLFLPFEILINNYHSEYWKGLESDWGNYNYFTYLLLREGVSTKTVAEQLTKIHHANQKESGVIYTLQPIIALHLYGPDMSEEGIQTVRIFWVVAIAILCIACINYINLATARATKRAQEVGVRKTIGASRAKLVTQFLIESSLVCVLAFLLALTVIQLAMPFYNQLSSKNISFELLGYKNILLLSGALIFTWITAGVYPALVLSSFEPLQVMRGKNFINGSNSIFRKTLVVTQFTLSIAIIIGTVVVGRQLSFIRNKKLGFDKENVFTFALRGDMFKNKETILNELSRNSGIESVSIAGQNILNIGNTTGDSDWEGRLPNQTLFVHPMNVKFDFIKMMNMELVEGRSFIDSKADTASYILNEAAIKQMGIKDPIGKSFTLWNGKGKIIGVVKDFHHTSMKTQIEPTIFFCNSNWLWLVYVKTNGKDNAGAVAAAEKIWKKYNPLYPLDYSFMDVAFDDMYKSEMRVEKIFALFSVIAIFISCLGLFGLAAFTTLQRVKEIGVRKVMGASVSQIVVLLSSDFIKLVFVALIVAIPVSYYGMQNWLNDFAYRITVDWSIFALSGVFSIVIALLTVGYQTIKAAQANPSQSLKNE
jgi:putative ABC transport system permease protein